MDGMPGAVEIAAAVGLSIAFLAAVVLSVVFVLQYRENGHHWLPAGAVLALPLFRTNPVFLSGAPSNWSAAAFSLLWGAWAIWLAWISTLPNRQVLSNPMRFLFFGLGAVFFLGGAAWLVVILEMFKEFP